jgi:hypothetical protein
MRVENLPSPGLLSNGIRIRIEAAKAISAVEINAGIPANGGISSTADPLHDFFTACAAAINGFRDVTVPVIAARSVSASQPSVIVLTYSEGLDPKRVPLVTDFAVTVQARTVTKVVVDGPFVFLHLSAPLVAGAVSVAYTQNAGNVELRLQDESDNQAASFAATAVTNGIV